VTGGSSEFSVLSSQFSVPMQVAKNGFTNEQ
jgi:hypothetical protein